jgi:DNA-binding transcriptional MerR regulator
MIVFGTEYWSVTDIARQCGDVHRDTVYHWMKTRVFPPARLKQGKSRYWDPKEIIEFYRIEFVEPLQRAA